jgi:hypothetical protein
VEAFTNKAVASELLDMEFIAESRTLLPAALDEIARLKAENERLRAKLESSLDTSEEQDRLRMQAIAERDTAIANCERMRPVYEAAIEAVRANRHLGVVEANDEPPGPYVRATDNASAASDMAFVMLGRAVDVALTAKGNRE